MGRPRKFTDEQVAFIRQETAKTNKELAQMFSTSVLTIYKIRNYKDAYAKTVQEIGMTPVLNMNGEVVSFTDVEPEDEDE